MRNVCLHLLALPLSAVLLGLLGGQALASGLSAPIGRSAVAGAVPGAPSQSSVASSPTVLPVSIEQHPSTPATTNAASVTAPLVTTATSAVTSVSNTAAAPVDATTKTVGPAIKATTANTATRRTAETVAPVIAATRRTAETVTPAIAATRRTVVTTARTVVTTARTVVTTAGSTLGSTATVAKDPAAALVVAEAADRGVTSRVSQTPSIVSGIARSVVHDTNTASEGDIESTESALASRNTPLGLVSRKPPTRPTSANASKASGRQTQPTLGALPSPQFPPSGSTETIKQIASSPASTDPTDPAGAPSALPACTGSAVRPVAEALIVSCASAGPLPLSRVSAAQLLGPLIGTKPSAAFTFSGDSADHHAAGSTVRVPPTPTPAPLPQGSSGAMAGGVGVAFSIFLILAGLLLLGGMAAMRLLRLASESWRMAQFALVPERPG